MPHPRRAATNARSENESRKRKETQHYARHELEGRLFQTSRFEDFLDTFLPVTEVDSTEAHNEKKDLVTDALAKLVAAGHYNETTKLWTKLAKSRAPETDFYPEFIKIADLCTSTAQKSDAVRWIDTHATGLRTGHKRAIAVKPDLVSANTRDLALPVAWCDTIMPFEVKKSGGVAGHLEGLAQLLTYVREVMRDQPNRRFCFGVQIAKREAHVWLFDRSGGLGCIFDFHQVCQSSVRVLDYNSGQHSIHVHSSNSSWQA